MNLIARRTGRFVCSHALRQLLLGVVFLISTKAEAGQLVDFRADMGLVFDSFGRVVEWNDQSSNHYLATSTFGPMQVVGATGRQVLRFDGSVLPLTADPHVPANGTLFIVFGGVAGSGASGRPMGWEDGQFGQYGAGLLAIPGLGVDAILRDNFAIGDILSAANATTLEVDAISWGPDGVTFERLLTDGSSGAGSNPTISFVSDGGVPLHIGSSGDDYSGTRFTGELAELMVSDLQLSAQERQDTMNVLYHRWIAPLYHVCLLYGSTKAVPSGATDPIKLQLCDSGGNDLSSSTIVVHGTGVTQTSTSISGPVQSPGNANPDTDFRFDPNLGPTGGYIFNLKTTGLTTGSYTLNFTVTGDSFVYPAPFQVK